MNKPEIWYVSSNDDSGCSSGEIYLPIIEYYPDTNGDRLSKNTSKLAKSKTGPNRKKRRTTYTRNCFTGSRISYTNEEGSSSNPGGLKPIGTAGTVDAGNHSNSTSKRKESKSGPNRKKPRTTGTPKKFTRSRILPTNEKSSPSKPDVPPGSIHTPGTVDAPQDDSWTNTGVRFTVSSDARNFCRIVGVWSLKREAVGVAMRKRPRVIYVESVYGPTSPIIL